MFNPNASKTKTEYGRIENTLADMTPNPRHFEGRLIRLMMSEKI
mgnify:CR=1 FL=1